MFCYTVVSGIRCVLQELIMWSEISSQHPTFIKTVAKLTNKKLGKELIADLDEVSTNFAQLEKEAQEHLDEMSMSRVDMQAQYGAGLGGMVPLPITPHSEFPYEIPGALPYLQQPILPVPPIPQMQPMQQAQMPAMFAGKVRRLVDRFIQLDKKFLDVLPRVKGIGKEDKVWQILLSHITHEQEYMYTLMRTLRSQLK